MKLLIKLVLCMILIVLNINFIFALNLTLNTNEEIKVINVHPAQRELIITGNLTIENPSVNSSIYEYEMFFKKDYIFDSYIYNDNKTFRNEDIIGYDLEPNETLYIDYKFQGIIPVNVYNNFNDLDISFLEWYLDKAYFVPQKYSQLNKLDLIKNKTNSSHYTRNIIINISNPSEFDTKVDYVNLYRTHKINSTNFLNSMNLLARYENINLKPKMFFYTVFDDLEADDKSTYWLEYRIGAEYNFKNTIEIIQLSTSGGGSNKKDNSDNGDINFDLKDIIITKYSNVNFIKLNDIFTITLKLQNPNSVTIKDIELNDYINIHFEPIISSNWNNNSILNISIPEIKSFENKVVEYDLKYSDYSDEEVIYLSPANIYYNDKRVKSNKIYLLNDIESINKKIIIEKQINRVNENLTEIIIDVTNVGDVVFYDLTITDNDKKWKISKLDISEKWQTRYEIIKETNIIPDLPEIYGTGDAKVYKTIILNEKITSINPEIEIELYQKFMIGIAIILLIVDIVF